MNSELVIQICAQIFSICVGIISIKKGSVSISGLIALLVISSFFIWFHHIALLIVLFGMYASSSLLTKYKSKQKTFLEDIHAKTGPRDYKQAFANLGVATICVIILTIYPNEILIAAFAGSVAAGNADSWASELGVLSKKTPVMITTFKPIRKGMSGGVTLAGLTAGFAGSLFIAILIILALHINSSLVIDSTSLFFATLFAGFLGCIIDSLLGAALQSSFFDESIQDLTEKDHGNNNLVKGIKFIDNDAVNFLTTLSGAIISGILYLLIH